jgi:hypothetical protein
MLRFVQAFGQSKSKQPTLKQPVPSKAKYQSLKTRTLSEAEG